jgi:peptidoglycan/LPS O-acetylase OafA/YrhL
MQFPREPAAAHEAFLATRHFSGLDALRAFSVLGVIWTHVTPTHGLTLLNQGREGVNLFFAISGFLVTTLLLRERRRTGGIALRDFYIRRTLRIFPLYYAVLLLYAVLVALTLRGTPKGAEFWAHLPAFATYTSNWFVDLGSGGDHGVTFYFAWSLATEEQFYLLWPAFMVFLLRLTGRQVSLVGGAALLLCMQIIAAQNPAHSFLSMVIASLAPAILLGVIFAVLLDNRAAFALLAPVLGARWAAPVAALAVLACLQAGAPMLPTRFAMAVLVASVCIREDTVVHPLLKWRPLASVGSISYGMYLMHMLAANAVRRVVGHDFGVDVFLGTAMLVTLMAGLSFLYFESPILALKSRFTGPRGVAVPLGGTPAG